MLHAALKKGLRLNNKGGKMKKIITLLFLNLLLLATTGFAQDIILDNQTSYPNKDQKKNIAIQWADSAKEVDDNNKALMYGFKLNPSSIQNIAQSGKVNLNIPEKAKHFRILAWSKEEGGPDFITNWVDIEPNKIYSLEQDHLSPTVLMVGSGC
jgi:hypothetical protein